MFIHTAIWCGLIIHLVRYLCEKDYFIKSGLLRLKSFKFLVQVNFNQRNRELIMSYKKHHVSVVIPAHNEAQCIGQVVEGFKNLRNEVGDGLIDDIVVCSNGSTDNTSELARNAGARVVQEFRLGYGFACLRGLSAIRGVDSTTTPDIVVFADGDHSVAAAETINLLDSIIAGNDLVVGNRETHLQERQALSAHQRFGNNLASALIRLIWNQPISDLGPFRAIRYSKLLQLDMRDERFGWTVEMQVKAIQAGMKYAEVPVTTLRRVGKSKISGTIKGTIGAAVGIFGKIFELYVKQATFLASLKKSSTDSGRQRQVNP